MGSPILSARANQTLSDLDVPWRFAPAATYDPETNPDGLISFALAENKLVDRELEAFVSSVAIHAEAFSYAYSTAGGRELPVALARHLNEYFSPYKPLDGSEIQITGAATALHEILGWALGDPGDGILTSKPVYGRFELDFGNKVGLHVVYAATDAENSFDVDVIEKFEDALATAANAGKRIRALLIVNPNNPVGRCYPRDTLAAIMSFCQKHRLHFISDEIYGCSVYDAHHPTLPPFTSALSIDPTGVLDEELFHVTYGFAKDFAVPGLRLGAIVSRSKAVHRAVKGVIRFHNPSGASVVIGTAMLNDREWCRGFLDTSRAKISTAYKHLTSGLDAMGIKYLQANAGFFIYVDLSPYLDTSESIRADIPDFALAQRFVDHGVFLQPCEEHGPPGWYRLVFTQDPRVVTEGLRRIQQALKDKHIKATL